MEPTIEIGDIIIVKKTDDIKERDIISFRVGDSVVTHRVTQVVTNENGEKQYITKGDANNCEDIGVVKKEDIQGKYCFKISKIGTIILFLHTKNGIIVLIIVVFLILLFLNRKTIGKHSK